jgi:polyferredoxin
VKVRLGDIRRATQLAMAFLCNAYVSAFITRQIYKGPLKGVCVPFLYCYACPSATFACPIGTLQHYAAIHQFPFFLIGHLAVLGLIFGRMACGWLCPFGLLQDLLYRIKSVKIEIPPAFRVISYFTLLGLAILIPFATGDAWFSKTCPIGTLVAGIPWVVWNPINPETGLPTVAAGSVGFMFVMKIAILIGFLILFVIAKRPFCKFVCPMGLFWSCFNRISILQLKVAPGCMRCDKCEKLCPVGIKVYEDPGARECIRCLKCTECAHVKVEARMPGALSPDVGRTPTVRPGASAPDVGRTPQEGA